MTTISNRPVTLARRPVAAAAAPVAPSKAPQATGPAKTGGKVVGGVAGAVGGFSVGAAGMMFLGLAKWGMERAPGWYGPVAWAGIAAFTALGGVGGAKFLGGLGEKLENWIKK